MKTEKHIPDSAITVRTYAELEVFAANFAAGKINLLGVVGTAGLAKSQTVREVMRKARADPLFVNSHATAFILYQQCFYHQNMPIILDDVDTLYEDRKTRPLLKALCETTPTKIMQWNSRAIDDESIPRQYSTTSRVCILANEWKTVNGDMKAVADRGLFLNFTPTPQEVHRQVGTWFQDHEVYDLIGQHLRLVTVPSMRYYVKAQELKGMGEQIPWKDMVLNMLNPDLDRRGLELLSGLLADEAISDNQRERTWVKETQMSRATYFRYKKLLTDPRKAA